MEKTFIFELDMEFESVMVTGANRGIGLEFVRQIVKLPKPPHFLFATYRNESTLQALKKVQETCTETQIVLIQMDAVKKSDIERAKKTIEEKVGKKGLNLLINNAGVGKVIFFPEVTEEDMIHHFTGNTVGPVLVLKTMLPLLQTAAALKTSGMNVSRSAVINMTSATGSFTSDTQPKEYLKLLCYRTSKVALNMAMRIVALTIEDQGILVVNMCPGWVKTDLTSGMGYLEPSESISAMLNTFPNLNESHHGAYLDRNGNTIPF